MDVYLQTYNMLAISHVKMTIYLLTAVSVKLKCESTSNGYVKDLKHPATAVTRRSLGESQIAAAAPQCHLWENSADTCAMVSLQNPFILPFYLFSDCF